MPHDVVFHLFVGQALVGLLIFVLPDMALNDAVLRIVLAHLLQMLVFVGRGVLGVHSESAIHNNQSILMIDMQSILLLRQKMILMFQKCL